MDTEPEPCRYCGAIPEVVGDGWGCRGIWQVRCETFGCPTRWPMFTSREAAIERWNRRIDAAIVPLGGM
jgi:hypothetical protein